MIDKYSGCRTCETWAVNLWLGSDQGLHGYWRDVTREVADAAKATTFFTREEEARIALASRLRAEIGDGSPCQDCGLYPDLLNAASFEVDWHEAVESLLGDVVQDAVTAARQ